MELVSIITPTFNRSKFLPRLIESLKKQSYPTWELIIVDDGSTDDTKEVVQEYIKNDKRIKFISYSTNKGACFARNKGIQLARGEFINFLDSDDEFACDKLQKQVSAYRANPNLDVVVCGLKRVTAEGEVILNNIKPAKDLFLEFIKKDVLWLIHSPLWKKDFIIKNKLSFNSKLSNSQDFEFIGLAILASPNIEYIVEPLAIYYHGAWDRIGTKKLSAKIIKSLIESRLNLLKKARNISGVSYRSYMYLSKFITKRTLTLILNKIRS